MDRPLKRRGAKEIERRGEKDSGKSHAEFKLLSRANRADVFALFLCRPRHMPSELSPAVKLPLIPEFRNYGTKHANTPGLFSESNQSREIRHHGGMIERQSVSRVNGDSSGRGKGPSP